MIDDLDRTLKALLVPELQRQGLISDESSTGLNIEFATPDKDWANSVNQSTLSLFLYDIRENLQLRSNERYLTRDGTIGTESHAPTRIDFTYLISVWNKKSDDLHNIEIPLSEHQILGKVLKILLSYPILPQEALQGAIRDQSQIPGAQLPRAWIAQPEDTPKTWEFWGGNEWRLKASISYRVTLYIQPAPVEVELVTQTTIQLQLEQQINSQ